jgi:hypothetical protein
MLDVKNTVLTTLNILHDTKLLVTTNMLAHNGSHVSVVY